MSATVTIAVASAPLGADRHLVVAWFAAVDGKGTEHTRGLAEIWVGGVREGLARIATQALTELTQPSTVELVLRRHDPLAPPPTPETAAALVEAWERHTITFTPVRAAGVHAVLEAAEAFAVARAAGVRSAPSEAVHPKAPPLPPIPGRLF